MRPNNKNRKGSESSNDDDDSQQSNQLDTDNSPKIIPVARLPDRLKTKKIIINISDTQYPIIEQIAEQMGWCIQHNEGCGDWDLWWTDRQITPDTLYKMNLYQKINHYPGIYVLARKNMLGLNLMAMKQKFESEYRFFPDTWVIPIQFSKFRNFYESVQKGKARTYIVKPQALSQGRGIFLTRNIEDIMTGHKYVVQRYIKNPFLIDGLKFDLRIYVLLAGTDPLRLYIYEDGLGRFATEKYEEPTFDNLGKSFVHLTNYSLNKNNPNYIYNKSEKDVGVGHKRTLKAIYEQIQKLGHNVELLKVKINDIIVKTVISGLPAISHQYRYCQPQQYENNMCFHILGFDIMLTDLLEPILIQINHTPSFETSTPLDYMVKKNLIKDTLKLMRIKSENKKVLFQKSKLIIKRRIETGKRQIVKGRQRQLLIQKAQEERDLSQENLFGGYAKIFPTDDDQVNQRYKTMIKRAEEVHKSTDEERRKLIKQEQQKYRNQKKGDEKQKEKEKEKEERIRKANSEVKKKLQYSQKKIETQSAIEKNNILKIAKDKAIIQFQLLQNKPQSIENNERNQTYPHKNLNFRTKVKKCLPPTNPADQLMRFSELMLKIVSKRQMKSEQINDEESYFMKVRESILKKSKISLTPVSMIKSYETQKRGGGFIKPKTYEIIDSKSYKVMNLNQKLREGNDSIQNSLKEKESLEMAIKNKYKKRKRMSVV